MSMSQCCSIAARPDADLVAEALAAGDGLRTVATRFDLSKSALGRHREHLGIKGVAPGPPVVPIEQQGKSAVPKEKPGTPKASSTQRPSLSPSQKKPKANRGKNAPRLVQAAKTEDTCMDLRVKGYTFEQIEAETGIPATTAATAVNRVRERSRENATEKADVLREVEVRQCMALIKSLYDRATDSTMASVDVPADTETGVRAYDGQDKAADRMLKAMERLSKLVGLDAPVKQEITVQQVLEHPAVAARLDAIARVLKRHPEVNAEVLAELDNERALAPRRLA